MPTVADIIDGIQQEQNQELQKAKYVFVSLQLKNNPYLHKQHNVYWDDEYQQLNDIVNRNYNNDKLIDAITQVAPSLKPFTPDEKAQIIQNINNNMQVM